jgi:predicted AlkP superfamily phosphohydrolase/phosphomutase
VTILVALLLLSACQRQELTPAQQLAAKTSPSGVKVLLVGIDGATFRVLDPLLEAGELPVMADLIQRGARGMLESRKPFRSPALWTTVATGKSPKDHGVKDFKLPPVDSDKRRPILVSSHHRRSLALWNMLGPFGLQVGFLGWWVTWPAEPVNGWIVSDRITHSRWIDWTRGFKDESLTFPPELVNEVRGLVVDPKDPPMDEIDQLVELSDEERSELVAATRPIYGHWLSVFKFGYCSQRSYEKMALQLLDKEQPDLVGVFLIANDPICHTFWHFYEPDQYTGVDPEQAARLGKLIPNFQRHNDRYLAQLLSKVDPDTVVMLISDHGFRASNRIPTPKDAEKYAGRFDELWASAEEEGVVAVGQSGAHTLHGILIAAGGPIRQGVETEAHLYDIAPTVLALLGLPVPEDMPGRVLEDIIEPEFLERYPIRTIDSYESYLELPRVAIAEQTPDEEALEMLRSLGYIQ